MTLGIVGLTAQQTVSQNASGTSMMLAFEK